MAVFNLLGFVKFTDEYCEQKGSWIVNLHQAGYPSAEWLDNDNSELIVVMDDIEYTWFVLRWSA